MSWLASLLGIDLPYDGGSVEIRGQRLVRSGGILRAQDLLSAAQAQTADVFGFKWARRDTFDSAASLDRIRTWLIARYGDLRDGAWLQPHGPSPLLLDAGCGGAVSALELFGDQLGRVRYLGADVSDAVDVARDRFRERSLPAEFLQVDLMRLPLAEASVDIIFSEGVLHHTDSTEAALKAMARLLKPGGRFLFYVYRRKGPIREFTDDYIRERLHSLPPQAAWEALRPLSRLGQALGELDIEIDVPEAIDLLQIPAGPINLQRFFYWHVFKAFHHPDLTLDEMHHINFDWYAPKNAHRQSPEEVRSWCADAGLAIEREIVEEAGITVIARKADR